MNDQKIASLTTLSTASSRHIRIGTRGSALALYQANLTQSLLEKNCSIHGLDFTFELVVIKTTGDKVLDRRLSDMGGKALFTKEIDLALLDDRIDIAVHSLKDCETFLPPAFELACVLEREDPRDALITLNDQSLDALPHNSTFGTCSLRRTSQLLHIRPDIKPILFRGNIQTRIQKVKANINTSDETKSNHIQKEADCTLLALSGLKRMKLEDHASYIFPPDVMTPCVGQGAIGIVCLKDRVNLKVLLDMINHQASFDAIAFERFFLEHIQGHCGTPVGGLMTFDQESHNAHFIACVATPDGQNLWRETLHESRDRISITLAKLGKEMRDWLEKHDV